MNTGIHCLMVRDGMLNDEMRSKLYQVARDMLLESKNSKRFKTKFMEGVVVTENKIASMGFIGGTICEADIEHNGSERMIKVKFIMSKPYMTDDWLDEHEWESLDDRLKQRRKHPANFRHLN